MQVLLSSWACYFTTFYLAALACGMLVRRGVLPLHVSALSGICAYVFALLCSRSDAPLCEAAIVGVIATVLVSAGFCTLVLRVRGATAALAAIAAQLLFDQYVLTADWTGQSQGLWRGIPVFSPAERLLMCALFITLASSIYIAFGYTAAPPLIAVDGYSPALVHAAGASPTAALFVAAGLAGFLMGLAGLCVVFPQPLPAKSATAARVTAGCYEGAGR